MVDQARPWDSRGGGFGQWFSSKEEEEEIGRVFMVFKLSSLEFHLCGFMGIFGFSLTAMEGRSFRYWLWGPHAWVLVVSFKNIKERERTREEMIQFGEGLKSVTAFFLLSLMLGI